MEPKDLDSKIQELHRQACLDKKSTYVDPISGYQVFTEWHHRQRGSCCHSGCRHCPWKENRQKDRDEK